MIDRTLPGVSTTRLATQGWKTSGTARVTFEDVKVPVEMLIGSRGHGFKAIMHNFNHERLMLAISSNRNARICMEDAIRYAKSRRTFGKRLIDHQVIRHKIAEMARGVLATHTFIEDIVIRWPESSQSELAGRVALLKVQATKTFEFCAREASQILGGRSYLQGSGPGARIERLYREVRVNAIGGGSEEVSRLGSVAHAEKRSATRRRRRRWCYTFSYAVYTRGTSASQRSTAASSTPLRPSRLESAFGAGSSSPDEHYKGSILPAQLQVVLDVALAGQPTIRARERRLRFSSGLPLYEVFLVLESRAMLRCGRGRAAFTLRVVSPQGHTRGAPLDSATLESASIWGGSLRVIVDWEGSDHGWLVHARVVRIQRTFRRWLDRCRSHAAATKLQTFLRSRLLSDLLRRVNAAIRGLSRIRGITGPIVVPLVPSSAPPYVLPMIRLCLTVISTVPSNAPGMNSSILSLLGLLSEWLLGALRAYLHHEIVARYREAVAEVVAAVMSEGGRPFKALTELQRLRREFFLRPLKELLGSQ
ncbi:hypothetical protein FOL46_000998, partial [Perkinsus olseni]